jgi:hypothetical protein
MMVVHVAVVSGYLPTSNSHSTALVLVGSYQPAKTDKPSFLPFQIIYNNKIQLVYMWELGQPKEF